MPVYVDTAALVALVHKRDALHAAALAVYQQLLQENVRFLTTHAVLLEVGNTFGKASHKPLAAAVFGLVSRSASWQVLPVDSGWYAKGVERFLERTDKDWSLTDCIGMVAAEAYRADRIFTSDHHFRQAGFTILL